MVETLSDDDPVLDYGRERLQVLSALNSINITVDSIPPSADVFSEIPDDIPEVESPEVDDDPEAFRAQIDTGAFVSCTDQKHLLHNYSDFDTNNPSPVKLMPATEGSDAVPWGVGFLHVPAHNVEGYLAVRTFYHPHLRTTVIDERDFAKAAGLKAKEIDAEQILKYHRAGTFTYCCSHKLRHSQDVVVHGVLRHGKCYNNNPMNF